MLLKKDGVYHLAASSARLLLCKECGGAMGDPFEETSVDRNVLVVTQSGGGGTSRWSETQKFRFDKGKFFLIGTTTRSFSTALDYDEAGIGDSGENLADTNWLTGERHIRKRSEDAQCQILVDKTVRERKKPLVPLDDFARPADQP